MGIASVASKIFKPIGRLFKSIGTTKVGVATKNIAGKIGSIFATKAGKIGLAAAGVGAITAGSIFAYKKYYSGKTDNAPKNAEVGSIEIDFVHPKKVNNTEKPDTVKKEDKPADKTAVNNTEKPDTVKVEDKPADKTEVNNTEKPDTVKAEDKPADKKEVNNDEKPAESKEADKKDLVKSLDDAIGILNDVKGKLNNDTEKNDKVEKTEKNDNAEEAKETEETDKTAKNEEAKETEKPAETDKAEKDEKPKEAKDYTVVKGDCVWNIAKADLEKQNGTKPTNAQILKRTHEIMDINKEVSEDDKKSGYVALKWEPDNYHVMIRPGDKLKLTA
jgi:hypothetical protein